MWTVAHCWDTPKSVLNLNTLPHHCPIQPSFRLYQVLVHPRILSERRVLQNAIGDGFVEQFAFSVCTNAIFYRVLVLVSISSAFVSVRTL
jgi:hypothetical protein